MYDTIIDKIAYKPENCLLELCFKCNLNCKHCGSSLNAFKDNRQGPYLELKDYLSILDEIEVLGGKRIGLVGGEPLLCDFWSEVAQYASSKGFTVSMISNGMLIDFEMAQKIKDSGVKLVALSLDGPEEYHNDLRGSSLAYKNVMRAIDALASVNVQVNIVTTIMKDNLSLLPITEKLLENKNISFWQLQLGIPMGKLEEHSEMVIEPEQLLNIEQFILEVKNRNNIEITLTDSIGYCSKNELILRNNSSTTGNRVFTGCMAGCRAVAVESNGNIKGCLSLQRDYFIEGNIKERTLADIWNDKNSFSYNRKFTSSNLKGKCKECLYGNICRGGCTSLAYNTTGCVNQNEYCLHILEEK